MRRRKLNWLIFSPLLFILGSCGTAFLHTTRTHDARIGEQTALSPTLQNLPEPKEPIIVAVYQFRDQTGQYKPQEGGSSFSTAVTQGASNILVKVLADSKWFSPIERENIGDLLNERKIIRSTRQQFGINEELPALLYAGMLLEGGIVSYDANVITGGAGLRYFGAGGSSQYRQDRVTVYLRAVSVSTGKVLKTVYASKMVLSQSVDGGIFRFVKFQRLLEAETGFTYNEPSELAVTEAIEKAVESLVYEGINDGLWELKKPKEKTQILDNWKKEKEQAAKMDALNRLTDDRRRGADFALAATPILYKGDFAGGKIRLGGEIGLGWNLKAHTRLGLRFGLGELATAAGFKTATQFLDLDFRYRHTPQYSFSPDFHFGAGAVRTDISGQIFPKIHVGAGMEWLLGKSTGLQLGFDYHYAFSDKLDKRTAGSYNDAFWSGRVGLNFYFGKKLRNKKSLAADGSGPPKPKGGVLRDF